MRTRNSLLLYYALVFGISWTGFLVAVARNDMFLLLLAMVAGPTGTTLALTAAVDGRRGLRQLAQALLRRRVGARWYAGLLVAPALLLLVLGGLSLISPAFLPAIAADPDPAAVAARALAFGLIAGIFEELGWTGYVTPRLLRRFSWFTTGVVIGLPWALWHALPDYLGRPDMASDLWVAHMLQWFVALTAFRIFMTWIYSHSRSLLLGMLLHVSFTGSQSLLWPAATGEGELIWYGTFAIALWGVVAAVVVFTRAERRAPLGSATA